MNHQSPTYRWLIIGLLSLNFGIVFFDRNALNFLMPFVKQDIPLTNVQIGILASALSLTWAVAGYLISAASERSGKRKMFLVLATIAFSLCSFLSGIAPTFLFLLGTRLLMGAAEGAILPISQSIISGVVAPHQRGIAMGLTQNFGSNLLGSFVAPVALVALATWVGWRYAFFIAGVPGIITAFLMWRLLDESEKPDDHHNDEPLTMKTAFAERNVLLCSIIAVLLVSYLVITWSFMPIVLTEERGFDPSVMSWLMGALGISAAVTSFLVPGISDRIGRKPVMVGVPLVSVILPLSAIYFEGSHWALAAIFFVGWSVNGLFPMFMATIPSESVNPRYIATVAGLVMATGEVLGGVCSPFIAGVMADAFGLAAPMWMILVLALLASLVALGLRETAPMKVGAALAAEQ